MAIAFRAERDGIQYEVRTAGSSVRLYTNGAFHSQYNPRHLFTGAVWDLLSLPSLAMPEPPQSMLLLGVGGGSVIHQLQQLHAPGNILGVEIDPLHIRIAREYFGVRYPNVSMVCSDAYNWLRSHRQRWDYLIDDVFQHGEDDPLRPFDLNRAWYELLAARLKTDGAIIQNHIDPGMAHIAADAFRQLGLKTLQLETAGYTNRVVAAFDSCSSVPKLRTAIRKKLAAMPRRDTSRLRHQLF